MTFVASRFYWFQLALMGAAVLAVIWWVDTLPSEDANIGFQGLFALVALISGFFFLKGLARPITLDLSKDSFIYSKIPQHPVAWSDIEDIDTLGAGHLLISLEHPHHPILYAEKERRWIKPRVADNQLVIPLSAFGRQRTDVYRAFVQYQEGEGAQHGDDAFEYAFDNFAQAVAEDEGLDYAGVKKELEKERGKYAEDFEQILLSEKSDSAEAETSDVLEQSDDAPSAVRAAPQYGRRKGR